MISSKDCSKKQIGVKFACIVFAVMLLLCSFGCTAKPAANTAVVRYRNQDAVIPMTFENVYEVREYFVNEKLYQVLVYIEDVLTPVVFTQLEIVDYAYGDGIEFKHIDNEVFHTYDPILQSTRNGPRKEWVTEKYLEYYGREPSEREFDLALDKLIQKVVFADLEARLSSSPEAVAYKINSLRGKQVTTAEQKRIVRMLERGDSVEEIVEAFVK